MSTAKPFKNIAEQIAILKRRNLRILNENATAKLLTDYGYYEVINGYKYPFLKDKTDDDEGYKKEATFEHIFGLYQFDANLRDCVIFGQTMYFFNLLKNKSIKEKIIARMTGQNINTIRILDESLFLKQAFGDSLNLILAYRNLSAHGGRIYNYRSHKHQITIYSPFIYNNYSLTASHSSFQRGEYRSSIRTLLACLAMMANEDPFNNLRAWINVRLNEHLKNYPEDETYLFKTMELDHTIMS
ncbi:Abi family protein [Limosilactobacillus caecicola]|uniref:Abi family protein n=1 Tax=Limosilactobacillus caecicola TaxID=2941332 RepID=UPI00203D3B25|nr:Abi family protein [Limosilactobacillus caecicola]